LILLKKLSVREETPSILILAAFTRMSVAIAPRDIVPIVPAHRGLWEYQDPNVGYWALVTAFDLR
jgi:hypothetical protein